MARVSPLGVTRPVGRRGYFLAGAAGLPSIGEGART